MAESWDSGTRDTVKKIPLLKVHTLANIALSIAVHACMQDIVCSSLYTDLQTRAGPREKEDWGQRLKEVRQFLPCSRLFSA